VSDGDVSGANLTGANVSRANVSRADVSGLADSAADDLSNVLYYITIIPAIVLLIFVVLVIVPLSAFSGKHFRLPIVGGLAEKQANR
jgi:hypothetical protein